MPWSLTSSVDGDISNTTNAEEGVVLISSSVSSRSGGANSNNNKNKTNKFNSNGISSSNNNTNVGNKSASYITSHVDSSKTPHQISVQQTADPSLSSLKLHGKDIASDVVTASSSKMVFSTPKHNKLVLDDDSVEQDDSESSSSQKPASPNEAAPVNQEHQDLLATTAALIRNQKSATPRHTSLKKSAQLKSTASPASSGKDPVVKSGSLALFSPRLDTEQSGLKSTRENEIVAKAMHFADMTQPKEPVFVVRKANKDDDGQAKSEDSKDHSFLNKRKSKTRNFVDGKW